MQPDLLWNVGGIPPEAREAARAAARREGMPVGEWLTRRILRPAGVAQPNILALPESWRPNPAANADGCYGVSVESEDASAGTAVQRRDQAAALPAELPPVDAPSQGVHNSPDPAEALSRLQNEVAWLAERQRQLEQRSTNKTIKDAITALHAGLFKLNEQATQASKQTGAHIHGFSQRVESLSSRIELTNCQMEITALQVKDELAGLGRRVDQLERLKLGNTSAALRNSIRELGAKVIEAENVRTGQLAGLKKGLLDLGTHIARSNVDQKIAQLDKRMSEFSRSGDRAQLAQKLSDELTRLARRLDSAEAAFRQDLAQLQQRLNPAQPQTPVQNPAKAAQPDFDFSAQTQTFHQSEPERAPVAALPRSSTREALPSARLSTTFGDFVPVGRQPALKMDRTGKDQRNMPNSEPGSASDKIRLRNIAVTSITVLLFALAAAYFLYHSRALASPLLSQQYLASTKTQNTRTAPMAGKQSPIAPMSSPQPPRSLRS